MDDEELRAVFDALVDLHRREPDEPDLDDGVHEMLLRVRPHHAEALAFAAGLPHDEDPAERAARADLLGETCNGDPSCVDGALPLVTAMAEAETDPMAIVALASALSKMWDPRTAPCLLRWARHPDPYIRYEVAAGLLGTLSEPHPDAVAALIELSRDPDPLVRDWATFSLGSGGATGPEVDRAFLDRLDDPDPDTRAEAFMALAVRRDARVIEPLIALLSGSEIGTLEVRAAATLADVRFHPPLLVMSEWWGDDDREVIEHAIRRCDPALRSPARATEARLRAGAIAQLAAEGIDVTVTMAGEYPTTEVVLTHGGETEHVELWAFDDDDPLSLDKDFTILRICNWARHMLGT